MTKKELTALKKRMVKKAEKVNAAYTAFEELVESLLWDVATLEIQLTRQDPEEPASRD